MSDWFDKSGVPANNSSLSSSAMRGEIAAIETAMAKLPALTGNGRKIVRVNSGETALEAVTLNSIGSVISASAVKSSAYPVTLSDNGKLLLVSGTTTITLVDISTTSDGFTIGVKNAGTAIVTVAPDSGDAISGVVTGVTLFPGEEEIYYSNGTTWYRLSQAYGNDYTTGSTTIKTHGLSVTSVPESYTKILEVPVNRGGDLSTTLRIHDQTSQLDGVNDVLYLRIYVNGSAVGTERSISTPGADTSWDEDITGLVRGDLLQVYTKAEGAPSITTTLSTIAIKTGLSEQAIRFGFSDYDQTDNTDL